MAQPHDIEDLTIGPDTRVSRVIRADERAIETLVALSPKFKKLRNPFLRKVMAPRVTLAEAARIGEVPLEKVLDGLKSLGFGVQAGVEEAHTSMEGSKGDPDLLEGLSDEQLHGLDVRPDIAEGKDPFASIMKALQKVPEGEALKLINSFEPIPLIRKLERRGYAHYVVQEAEDRVITYFRKKSPKEDQQEEENPEQGHRVDKDPDTLSEAYGEQAEYIDVRGLEMPEPMMRIIRHVRQMPQGKGLFVQHERVPRYLLPELEWLGFHYAMKELEDERDVRLFIFREGKASEG